MAVPNNFLPARTPFAGERSGECGDERRGVSRYESVTLGTLTRAAQAVGR